jgi:nucleoside-specific outer membrane channel protein Tsx
MELDSKDPYTQSGSALAKGVAGYFEFRKPKGAVMTHHKFKRTVAFAVLAACGFAAQAADWSDTSIGYRYGTKYREPFNTSDITKDILNLTHVSGYKYGTNFFNVDLLLSNKKDSPTDFVTSVPTEASAGQEVYVVYRNTLDLSKVTGSSYKFGPVRDVGITAGFDFNTKSGDGYESKKRMLVAGPTLMIDVPGFLNVSLLALWESNAPVFHPQRYTYDTHAMLTAAWGIPIGSLPLSFEGFANFIASKGKDESGNQTAAETNIDMQIMYDLGAGMGGAKNTFKVGLEYQYWKNKFGNDHNLFNDSGAFAKTPMIRAEYHF